MIKLGSPGLDLSTDHLSILARGWKRCFSDDNVVVYDIVDLVNIVDGILLAEWRKRIVSPILNFIIRNKFERFPVPCVSSTATSTYSIISPVKGATEYFNPRVKSGE